MLVSDYATLTEMRDSKERRRPGNQTRGAREMGQSAWLSNVASPYTRE